MLIQYVYFYHSATLKAVESAISSRQWNKAVQILEMQDSSISSKYYEQIADHYASVGEYEVRNLEGSTSTVDPNDTLHM